jgi:hypothetical protein
MKQERRQQGAHVEIVSINGLGLTIRDIGHAQGRMTVTNDVERVVDRLRDHGLLPKGRRLFYYDSDSRLDEIVLDDEQRFARFAPGATS